MDLGTTLHGTGTADVPGATSPRPLSNEERRRRGFCTCPQITDTSDTVEPCSVHPTADEFAEDDRVRRGLTFFDDRRNRFVSWPDAVEGMRQRRYAGAINDELVQFTWVMLIRLLEALRDPLGEPADEVTQSMADELITWSEAEVPEDHRRWLLGFARGGGSMALCSMFRDLARRTPA
jgi:hypothetical protein